MQTKLDNSQGHVVGALLTADKSDEIPNHEQTMDLLSQTAAILLRGFKFDADSFVKFSDGCCASFSTYAGGAFRFRSLDRLSLGAGGTLLSTTGAKQGFPIPLHGEMYYQKERPDTLWFFCKQAPEAFGQTTIADGQQIFEALPLRSKELLRSSKLRYIRDLSVEDWPITFQTNDLGELHKICEEGNAKLTVRLDNSIQIQFTCSALVNGRNGREIFINNLISVWRFEQETRAGTNESVLGRDISQRPPLSVRLEDGAEPPEWLIADIEKASDALTADVAWQNGDVLVVDNRRMLHGRRKAIGGDREILVRLGNLPESAKARD